MRNLTGRYQHGYVMTGSTTISTSGIVSSLGGTLYGAAANAGSTVLNIIGFSIDASNQVPTGAQTKPRALGALACVYLGS